MTYAESAVTTTISGLLAEYPDLDAAADGALDRLDQFHIGGADAVELLIPTLALSDADVVLDVGSGFGGPARQIARRTGNRVVGLDITPAYVDAARQLTEKAHLQHLVHFEACDIAGFESATRFPAAITMHVQMNVADKPGWFEHIGRQLTPGARLAVWEVYTAGGADPVWPMPWSLDGTDSFLVGADDLRAAVERAGFETVEWTPHSAWAQAWLARTMSGERPSGPTLPMLLDDGYTRVVNFATALRDGSLEIWRGCFTRTSGA